MLFETLWMTKREGWFYVNSISQLLHNDVDAAKKKFHCFDTLI